MKKKLFTLAGVLFSGSYLIAQSLPVSQSPGNKVALLEELTGINCQYCPDGHRIANELAEANPGKVVLVNIHAGGYANATPNYTTTEGNAINSFFNPDGYPTGSVQRTPFGGGTVLTTGRGNWGSQVNSTIQESSPANIAMAAEVDIATRKLKVTVEIYYTGTQPAGTKHFLNVGILQDGLISQQSGSGYNPDAVTADGKYRHRHMFRGFVNTGGTWGDEIDATQTGVITKVYEYDLPENVKQIPLELGDLSFYAFLHEGKRTASNSKVVTAAQINPTFLNAPNAKLELVEIAGEYNAGCDIWARFNPQLKIKNAGGAIQSVEYQYILNGQPYGTFTSSEAVAAMETKTISLPELAFSVDASNRTFGVKILSVNGGNGELGAVSEVSKNFFAAARLSSPDITLEILTDNYPGETSWQFLKGSSVISSEGPYQGNGQNAGGADALKTKSHNITLQGTGCYSLRLKDSYGDGLQYGTNPGGGFGYRVKQNGTVLAEDIRSSYDFGASKTISGVVLLEVLGTENIEGLTSLALYPNPAADVANIQVSLASESKVAYQLINTLGQIVAEKDLGAKTGEVTETINTAQLPAGLYIVNVRINDSFIQKTVTIIK